jgi:hypothetical protein
MGGARAYVPKEVREKKHVGLLKKHIQKHRAHEERDTPAWVQQIFETGGVEDEQQQQQQKHQQQRQQHQHKQHQQPQQMSRFSSAEGVAERKRHEAEAWQVARGEGEKEREVKLKARARQTKIIRRRTKKGQPLLSARMGAVLDRVQRLVSGGGKG